MDAFDVYLNDLVNQNKSNFSAYPGLKWLNHYLAAEAQKKRDKLTRNLKDHWLFKNTKPYFNRISKGCMICGQGSWSCLFITGKCNAGCFYCPASQLHDEVPSTQNLHFQTAIAYAEYINFFGFKGVAFSGGEPLLFFERTLEYLKQIRKSCDPGTYVWMYTNGILGDEQKFQKLADSGLNEIRFDIGATGFKLNKIAAARGKVQNLTIEIPAVPEEKERIKQLLPEMIKAGVTSLNLHQLRLTLHNAPKLSKRNYTYIHAEQPIVLESELAALEIMDYARQKKFDIGINYCSFFFKNRFQAAGFRRLTALALADPDEIITEKGFIREFTGKHIGYKALALSDIKPAGNEISGLKLADKTLFVKRETALPVSSTTPEQETQIRNLLVSEPDAPPSDPLLYKVWQKEYIERGLREY